MDITDTQQFFGGQIQNMNKKFKLIDKTLCNFLCHHIKAIEPLVGQTTSYDNGMIIGSYEYLHDPLFESLLTLVQPIVEEQYGKPLLPTYSCWRTYGKGQNLHPHKDRPSCEVSVSLHIGSSNDKYKWKFFVDEQSFTTKPGECVLYKGMAQQHWRNDLEIDWHTQAFLHYVEKDGNWSDFIYDKRGGLHRTQENSGEVLDPR